MPDSTPVRITPTHYLLGALLLGVAGVGVLLVLDAHETPAPAAAVATQPATPVPAAPAPPTVIVVPVTVPASDDGAGPVPAAVAAAARVPSTVTVPPAPAPAPAPARGAVPVGVPARAPGPGQTSSTAPTPTPARAGDVTTGVPAVPTVVQLPTVVNEYLASDHSILFIGPDGRLVASTGETSSSGVVAIGSDGSAVRSGPSTATGRGGDSGPGRDETGGQPVTAVAGGSGTVDDVLGWLEHHAIDYRDAEDHSLKVDGNDNIVTFDDSNLFLDHRGAVNANTGDTDSSGMNAVDVHDSAVTSGASGGSWEHDDDHVPPAPAGAVAVATSTGGSSGGSATAGAAAGGGGGGGAAAGAAASGGAATAAAVATPLTDTGDGLDDVSIKVIGDRNLVTEDDANITIGGTGKVNAQIGDSDTGGTVVMDVHGSTVGAACAADTCPPAP